MKIEQNNVPANNQVKKEHYIEVFNNNAHINVLFIGNSITRHEPKPEIGWEYDWGMAASKRENDYVHIVVDFLQKQYGNINYCIANCGCWELNYYKDEILNEWQKAKDFCADIIIVRLGENIYQAKEKFTEESIYEHYKKMLQYFCKKDTTKVILTDLYWSNAEIDDAIHQVAKELNYPIVHLGDLSKNNENMAIGEYWHNGVAMHPNDIGMKLIARRIIEKLVDC